VPAVRCTPHVHRDVIKTMSYNGEGGGM
jgi:hypothetical protein